MKASIFITRQILQPAIDLLKKNIEVVDVFQENRDLTPEELLAQVMERDAILTMLTDTIDDTVLEQAKNLKIIANHAVGYNNIDLEAASKRGIFVTNTPGVLTDATADFAWGLLFAVSRRITESDAFIRQKRFDGWAPMLFLGGDLTGKTLGIIGAGRVGTAMAKRSVGFGMKVMYHSPHVNKTLEKELAAQKASLETILKKADYISIHVPLTPYTKHLIGKKELDLMKPTAYLINTSRGAVVHEAALVKALEEKNIAGAGLDVFEKEPVIHSGLLQLSNVVMTPHIASATVETRTQMALMAAENILAALKGKKPPNLVNTDVLAKK